MRTGKKRSEGQSFHRRLLSEYDTDLTLDKYVAYFDLKHIVQEIQTVNQKIKEDSARCAAAIKAKGNGGAVGGKASDVTRADRARVRQLQEKFFDLLHQSFTKVRLFLRALEKHALVMVTELLLKTKEELLRNNGNIVPRVYAKVKALEYYREVNLSAFGQILNKFYSRCACSNLALQCYTKKVDALISRSTIAEPKLDTNKVLQEILAVYGTAHRLTLEEAQKKMSEYEYRAGKNMRRILPLSDSFYFARLAAHKATQGSFAVRILSGTTTLLCEKMLCEILQCHRYPNPCCGRFANGEVSVKLKDPVRGDDIFILQSMVAVEETDLSNSSALMELALMIHTAKLATATRITAVIPYLAYTCNCASMAVVAEVIEAMGCDHVITVDLYSEQVEGMFSIPVDSISAQFEFVRYVTNLLKCEGHDFQNISVVAPGGNFVGRAKAFADSLMRYGNLSPETQYIPVVTCVKRLNVRGNGAASVQASICSTSNFTTRHAAVSESGSLTKMTCGSPVHGTVESEEGIVPPAAVAKVAEGEAPKATTAYRPGGNRIEDSTNDTPDHTSRTPVFTSMATTAPGTATTLSLIGVLDEPHALASTMNPSQVASNEKASGLHYDPLHPSVASATAPSEVVSGHAAPNADEPLTAEQRRRRQIILASAKGLSPSSATVPPFPPPSGSLSRDNRTLSSFSRSPVPGWPPAGSSPVTKGIERALKNHTRGIECITTKLIETSAPVDVVGPVSGRLCIIVDTVVDKAINLKQVTERLKELGAARIIVIATHAVFSPGSVERIIASPIDTLIVTDSVHQDRLMKNPTLAKKLRVLPIAPMLARAIEKIHMENVLPSLFEK